MTSPVDVGMTFKDFVSLIITGILGLLWWDIRKIRGERDEHKKEVKAELKGMLSEHDHKLLCENAQLKSEKTFTEALAELKTEILEAIKK